MPPRPVLVPRVHLGEASSWRSVEAQKFMNRLHKSLDPTLTGHEAESLDRSLRSMIVGQNEAIDQIVNIYQTHLSGLNAPGRPIANLLFLGPTGSGKTRTVEATAEALVGNSRAVVKIDCAEFQHSHEIAKLIGSPPGYLGHRDTRALLSQETINQYHTDTVHVSFILFDEIEKASDALWNLLLGILDKATLTLGDNKKVDFSQSMIFMTSNLGAREMASLLSPRFGFLSESADAASATNAFDDKVTSKMAQTGVEAAKKKFTPEFMNRIDKVVVFKPLGETELRRILDLELGQVQQRVMNAKAENPFVFQVTAAGKDYLLGEGTDLKYGARHMKRAIERLLVQPLSNLIATGQVVNGDWIEVDFDHMRRTLTFHKEQEGLPLQTMTNMVAAGGDLPAFTKAASVGSETQNTKSASSSPQ